MNAIQRLVSAGMRYENAADIAMWYLSRNDEKGLESFVRSAEETKEEMKHGI